MELKKFKYDTLMGTFSVMALLKHGTRWLETTTFHSADNVRLNGKSYSQDKNALIGGIFTNVDNPYGSSKIKLKKFKRELIDTNICFVYRDPFESFKSAIITGAASILNNNTVVGKWDMDNLYLLMTTNQHFCYFFWRLLSDVLDENNIVDGIELVSLEHLSNYMAIKLLMLPSFVKETYDMNKLNSDLTKEEILYYCEHNNPQLWETFMEQIRLERIALDGLIEKFGWYVNKNTI